MTTVAEGVEDLTQAKFVLAHGCEYMQGVYFHRPVDMHQWCEAFYENSPTLE